MASSKRNFGLNKSSRTTITEQDFETAARTPVHVWTIIPTGRAAIFLAFLILFLILLVRVAAK